MYLEKERLLEEFCEAITYPIYYLSIKASQASKGQIMDYIPYQYSLHIEYSNGYIEHKEFIAKKDEDIAQSFVEQLCNDIPLECTIMSNQILCDTKILQQLGQQYNEYSHKLQSYLDKLKDLALPFKENWSDLMHFNDNKLFFDIEDFINDSKCCNKAFELGLEKDYVELLNEGATRCKELQTTLLEYSKIDTLMMVEILKKLRAFK